MISLIYAEVLDSTWWDDEVPSNFIDSTKNIGTEEEPNIVAKTWTEYLSSTHSKIIVKDAEDVTIKEYVCFSKGGHPVSVGNYTSAKLKYVTTREYEIYKDNKYLIHLATDADINSNPKDIDWKTGLGVRLQKTITRWAGVIPKIEYFLDEAKTILVTERVFTHTVVNRKTTKIVEKVYWYKADGTKEQLKPDLISTFDENEQIEMLTERVGVALKGALAWAEDNGYETEARALWDAGLTEYNESIRFGSDAFLQFIIASNAAFLSDSYSNPYAPSITTIKEALVSYLTFA